MQNLPSPQGLEWTILGLLKWSTGYFTSHDIDSPRATAEILLAHALNLKRIDLYLRYDQPLLKTELSAYKLLIKRRIRREPVAYITGTKEFWSNKLSISPDVLIPRPDTECLVETALKYLDSVCDPNVLQSECLPKGKVLELGVGSGAVVVALASERPLYRYVATDVSMKAILIARQNAGNHKVNSRIQFVAGDWLEAFSPHIPSFDMILSNPPYIPSGEIPYLQAEVAEFEPCLALDGGADGLFAIRRIISTAHSLLKPGGRLLLEIGCSQAADVVKIIRASGDYASFHVVQDYAGHDRVVVMQTSLE